MKKAHVWFSELSNFDQARVLHWLHKHPPPAGWESDAVTWAWCESSFPNEHIDERMAKAVFDRAAES